LPLFFGFAAATSLIVHVGILTHTSWFPAFLNGGKMKMSEISQPAPKVAGLVDAGAVKVASVATQ
jgi:hypothetical protein